MTNKRRAAGIVRRENAIDRKQFYRWAAKFFKHILGAQAVAEYAEECRANRAKRESVWNALVYKLDDMARGLELKEISKPVEPGKDASEHAIAEYMKALEQFERLEAIKAEAKAFDTLPYVDEHTTAAPVTEPAQSIVIKILEDRMLREEKAAMEKWHEENAKRIAAENDAEAMADDEGLVENGQPEPFAEEAEVL